jgi:hypothetical protein
MLNVLLSNGTYTLSEETILVITIILIIFGLGVVWLCRQYRDLKKGRSRGFTKWRVTAFIMFLFLTNGTDTGKPPLLSMDSGPIFLAVFLTGITIVLLWLRHNAGSVEKEIDEIFSEGES